MTAAEWLAIFQPIATDATTGITAIAGVALGVFGLIFVLKRGKGVFSSLAR